MQSCESCNIENITKVFPVPFAAHSVGLCDSCFENELYPIWLIISATSCSGGYYDCAEWFREIINKNLSFHCMTLEEFNEECQND